MRKTRGVYEHPPGSGVWWIEYYASGRRHREKVGKHSWAIKRYAIRKAEILEGRFSPPDTHCNVAALVDLVFDDYRVNRKNLEPIETSWKRLKPVFAARDARQLGTQDFRDYISKQNAAGYSNASLNRDLALLRRGYNLASRMTPPRIPRIPLFPARLKEAPPRSGFTEDAGYETLLAHAAESWLRAFLSIAYRYGLRKQEILDLRVRQIEANLIRLNPGETKNDEGRVVPLTAEVRNLLAPLLSKKAPNDWVFTREDGKHVRDFRAAWENLTAAAGLPGLLVHDFRRSAARNMLNLGIPEKTVMAITGHKTRAVFDRYNIIAETDILRAGKKLAAAARTAIKTATKGEAAKRANSGKVVSIVKAAS